jgi:hypothetical protein
MPQTVRLICSLTLGCIFGFLMNKAHMSLAPTIRGQMLFQRFGMIEMFLAALGTSMLSVSLILTVNPSLYQRVLHGFIQRNNQIDGICSFERHCSLYRLN